jgi:hypothetical protein
MKGETIDLPSEKAESLVKKGVLGEYDRYDWCFNVCMLTENQSRLCERARPCPRFGG